MVSGRLTLAESRDWARHVGKLRPHAVKCPTGGNFGRFLGRHGTSPDGSECCSVINTNTDALLP